MDTIAHSEQVLQLLNKQKTETEHFYVKGEPHPPFEIRSNPNSVISDNTINRLLHKCLRLGFDLSARRSKLNPTQWVLNQADKRTKRSENTEDTLKEGMSVKRLLEYTNAKLDMETIMVTIMESITNGVDEVTFVKTLDITPKAGAINNLQITRLKDLGYVCQIANLNGEDICIVKGW